MVRKNLTLIIIILSLFFISPVYAWETNPLKLLFKSVIYIYQRFVTTQDVQECQFVPSCSQFAKRSFALTNPVQALLMTSDRLQRCNPTAHFYYKRYKDSIHLSDPVEKHILFGRKRGK